MIVGVPILMTGKQWSKVNSLEDVGSVQRKPSEAKKPDKVRTTQDLDRSS